MPWPSIATVYGPSMTEKLPDVWTSRDYPVLVEVVRRLDGGERVVRMLDVATALGMPDRDVQNAGMALSRRRLLEVRGMDQWDVFDFLDASGEAYFLTGLHPDGDEAVSRLVSALRQAAELVDDPVEKGRLRTLADGALGIGREVLGGVLIAAATGGVGLT